MVSIRNFALLSAAGLALGQEISSLLPCAQTCYNNANALTNLGCPAGEVSCMCKNADWHAAIYDCAKASCEAGYADTVKAAANALCATATLAPPTAAATTSNPAPTSTAPAPTTPAPAPTETTSSSSTSSSTTSHVTNAALTTSTSTASSSSSTATSTNSKTHSSASAAAPAATTSSAAAAGPPPGSLTTATKIGIGVGVAAAAAALIGVAICALIRRRNNKTNRDNATKHWKISDPMPAMSGQTYAHDYSNSYETGLSELEMKSRRYEDMLPRQTPRQMV